MKEKKPAAVVTQPVDTMVQQPQKSNVTGNPRFVRCQIVGPDGIARPGWEMWLGDHCFGRADRKAMLLRSLERQQQPPHSFHWREVHRQRFTGAPAQQESDDEDGDEATVSEDGGAKEPG